MGKTVSVSELIGKTLISIENNGDELIFTCATGEKYKMYHDDECSEDVELYDICGDLNDLIGTPICMAEESTNQKDLSDSDLSADIHMDYIHYSVEWYSYTWTFYHFGTVKGSVDFRWLGGSNGYYSERADFVLL